jgi:hypothetical protein
MHAMHMIKPTLLYLANLGCYKPPKRLSDSITGAPSRFSGAVAGDLKKSYTTEISNSHGNLRSTTTIADPSSGGF